MLQGWPKETILQAVFDSNFTSSEEANRSDVEVAISYLTTLPAQATCERL